MIRTRPFDFQRDMAAQIERFGGRCLLAAEQGLGKSLTSLLWVHRNPEVRPVVVVCPASMKWTWHDECRNHFGIRATVLSTVSPTRLSPDPTSPIYILNYDILYAWVDWLRERNIRLCIYDECQFLADRRTRQSKSSRALCRDVPHVIGISGTPFLNRPAELYNILNMVRPDCYPSFHSYAHAHCAPKRTFYGWDYSGKHDLEGLHRKLLKQLLIRRLKKDVIDELPPKRRFVVPVEMTNPKKYHKASKDFLKWLSGQNLEMARRAGKAQQLVRATYLKHLAAQLKLRGVMEWVDNFLTDTDGKLLLFGVHKDILGAFKKRYSQTMVAVDGSVTGKKREAAREAFQHDPGTRLFVGNIRAAGTGLTLTAAHTIAFAELAWTSAAHLQAEDRAWGRINDLHGADVFYLVAKGSIEQSLMYLLQNKQESLNVVMDGDPDEEEFDVFDQLMKVMLEEKT